MKRIAILSGLLTAALIFTACNDDSSDGASGDTTNQNANPSVIPNAANLEMPRLDDQTGDIYSHYVTYNGTRVLNYTVDWHKEKKAFTLGGFHFYQYNGRATSWNRNNLERHRMERHRMGGGIPSKPTRIFRPESARNWKTTGEAATTGGTFAPRPTGCSPKMPTGKPFTCPT